MAQEKMLAMRRMTQHCEGHRAAVVNHLQQRAAIGCRGRRGVASSWKIESKGEDPDHSYCSPVFSVNRVSGRNQAGASVLVLAFDVQAGTCRMPMRFAILAIRL